MNKGLKIFRNIAIAAGCTALAATAGYIIYDKVMDSRTMGCKISIYHQDVSRMTVEEAADTLISLFESGSVAFTENGAELYRTSLKDAGYTLNRDFTISQLTQIKENRKPCLVFFEEEKDYSPEYQVDRTEENARETVRASHFDTGTPRTSSTDAYIQYDESQSHFVIVDNVLGTEINENALYNTMDRTLTESFASYLLEPQITVAITEEDYLPSMVVGNQKDLLYRLQTLNNTLDSYRNASITYTFGSTEETVPAETLQTWITIGTDSISINEAAMKEYISWLGQKYNTLYVPRAFATSTGTTVEISNNEYGYRIDEEAEFAQLKSEFESGTAVRRDPVYNHAGLNRNGNDDLLGSYVEVSIGAQHLWLYKDGALITETPVVTGMPTPERATYTGAYPIAYKESPSVLSSDIYGYETHVNYWMPFVYGQGLHDAGWRGSFGGQIYVSNGSHGCVNLPTDQAALIYNTIVAGYPIILY